MNESIYLYLIASLIILSSLAVIFSPNIKLALISFLVTSIFSMILWLGLLNPALVLIIAIIYLPVFSVVCGLYFINNKIIHKAPNIKADTKNIFLPLFTFPTIITCTFLLVVVLIFVRKIFSAQEFITSRLNLNTINLSLGEILKQIWQLILDNYIVITPTAISFIVIAILIGRILFKFPFAKTSQN